MRQALPEVRLLADSRGYFFECHRQNAPENHHQVCVPLGFARGFCVLSEEADILYQCSDYNHPASEVCIRWNDPGLAIEWPLEDPILSEKDTRGILLEEWS